MLKDGLLIRLNRNQRLRYVGYQLHEILSIQLTGRPVESEGPKNRYQNYEGTLQLNPMEGAPLRFKVQSIFFSKIQQFFEKPLFESKLKVDLVD